MKRHLYQLLGLLFFGVGSVGIFVPLLPTVPLWILAAICFASSSSVLQHKIYAHPQFGKTVHDFVEHGVLTRRNKAYAITGSATGTLLSLFIVQPPATVTWIIIAVMIMVAIWLATRPETLPRDL